MIDLRHLGHVGGIDAVGVPGVEEGRQFSVPMRIVMADEITGTEQIAVVSRILVAEGGVVRPDVVPGFADGVERRGAASPVGTVCTAEVYPEVERCIGYRGFVVGGLEVGLGKYGGGTAVRAENLDFDVLHGRMLHLETDVEDVVGGGEGRAWGELGEGDV